MEELRRVEQGILAEHLDAIRVMRWGKWIGKEEEEQRE